MGYLISALFLACLISVSGGTKQQSEQGKKQQVFIEPHELALPVAVHQPESPLEFVKALVIHSINGGGSHIFQVRNRGTKAIRAYTIGTVTSVGTGSEWGGTGYRLDKLLMPGQTKPQTIEDWGIEILPLTDELRNKYKLKGPMKGIIVFMVVRVEFADGSIYDAELEYKALRAFFEKNAIWPN